MAATAAVLFLLGASPTGAAAAAAEQAIDISPLDFWSWSLVDARQSAN